VRRPRSSIKDPGAWVADFIRRRKPLPASFETSRQRNARLEAENKRIETIQNARDAAEAAEAEKTARLTAQFESLPEPARLALLAQVKAESLAKTPNIGRWLKIDPEADMFLLAAARRHLDHGWTWEPALGHKSGVPSSHPLQEPAVQASQNEPVLARENRGDFATVLQTILTRPQLAAPVEQGSVKQAPAQTSPVNTDPVW
jgi:hypothetical protein